MTRIEILKLVILASVFLLVLAIGLHAKLRDCGTLLRRPGLLARSILSMNGVMLVFAIAVAALFHINPAIKIALIALAVSPVPPIIPNRQKKAGGSEDFAIGLLAAGAALSIVVVPLSMAVVGWIFGRDLNVPLGKVASIVLLTMLIPLAIGVLVHQFAPAFATKIAHPISVLATALLVFTVLPILVVAASAVWALIGSGMILFLVMFSAIGLVSGHYLGGPNPADRTVLAIATAVRHPAVALAIASINFPDQKAVPAVVLCHLIVGTILVMLYAKWRTPIHWSIGGPTATHA